MSQAATARLELATIRGIACLALVAYHVVGPSSDSGMHLPETSSWHYAVHSFDFLRMPLFSVLSGYFYARHRVTGASLLPFLRKKAVRLGAPLFFVTAVMLQLRWIAYGDPTTFFQAALFHYQHLWFLQALILIFLGITIWDSVSRPGILGLGLVGFAAVMISRSFPLTGFFSINGAFYLAPFFLFGMILREERALLANPNSLRAALWIVAVVMLVQQAGALGLGQANPIDRTSLPAVLCGCGAAYALFVLCPRVLILETVGTFSYTIYLWHSVAAAAARSVLEREFGLATGAEFLILLATGVLVPIAMHKLVESMPGLSVVVAGIRHSSIRASSWADVPRSALSGSRNLLSNRHSFVGGELE